MYQQRSGKLFAACYRGVSPAALLAGAAVLLGVVDPAAAQQANAADLDRLMAVIETQQHQIDALRAEVEAMKSAQPRAAPQPAPMATAMPA